MYVDVCQQATFPYRKYRDPDGHPAIRVSYRCRHHSTEHYKLAQMLYIADKVSDLRVGNIGRMYFVISSYISRSPLLLR